MHSNYSANGKQTLDEILKNTKEKSFDIISITDHDSLKVYAEIYEIVKNGLIESLIIPGIEFTVDNREYGNQCHMLQLFVNPKDDVILKDVSKNYDAMFNGSKIQFDRLNVNLAIQDILKNYDLSISFDEYKNYLFNNGFVPEYDTLCFYLIEKFKKMGVTTFEILDLLEKYNEIYSYEDRKYYKEKRYKKLREKYSFNDVNKFNSRFLLSMLAVREVDDDWWDYPACGSLSVNSYGQLKVSELNEKYDIYFAHPTEGSLDVVNKLVKIKKNIVGLEMNIRNSYNDINRFYNVLNKNDLIEIKGSDSHDSSMQFYENMDYYKVNALDFMKVLKWGRKDNGIKKRYSWTWKL
mgnify:CR=1 FL=1